MVAARRNVRTLTLPPDAFVSLMVLPTSSLCSHPLSRSSRPADSVQVIRKPPHPACIEEGNDSESPLCRPRAPFCLACRGTTRACVGDGRFENCRECTRGPRAPRRDCERRTCAPHSDRSLLARANGSPGAPTAKSLRTDRAGAAHDVLDVISDTPSTGHPRRLSVSGQCRVAVSRIDTPSTAIRSRSTTVRLARA